MWINQKITAVFPLATVASAAAPERITQPIDPARTTVLCGQVPRLAQAQYDQGAADSSPQQIVLTVGGVAVPAVNLTINP